MSTNPRSKLQSNGVDFTPTTYNDTYDFIKPEQFAMDGRAVLVTGASTGCGRATAISYAKAGASQIAIAARRGMDDVEAAILRAAKDASKAPPRVLKLAVDVTNEQSVGQAAEELERAFGRLDILVNNAGYLDPRVPMHESKPAEWWRSWEVNIKGPYLVTRALLPLMINSENSLFTVLNVASFGAHIVFPGSSGYQTTKLALLRFGEFLNGDYADKNILSFAVHPGAILTEMGLSLPEELHHVLSDTVELAADTMVWLTAERREWLKGRYVSSKWSMKELLEKRAKIESGDLLKVRMDVGMD